KVSASADVLKTVVFDVCRIIGMAGSWDIPDIIIVCRTCIGIADHGGKGRPAGDSVHQTAEKFRPVGFFPCRGIPAFSRCPAIQKLLQLLFIECDPRRQTVYDYADRRRM